MLESGLSVHQFPTSGESAGHYRSAKRVSTFLLIVFKLRPSEGFFGNRYWLDGFKFVPELLLIENTSILDHYIGEL